MNGRLSNDQSRSCLWWCLSADLKRAATDDGMDKPEYNTEALFLVRLKEIAVKGQNAIVG